MVLKQRDFGSVVAQSREIFCPMFCVPSGSEISPLRCALVEMTRGRVTSLSFEEWDFSTSLRFRRNDVCGVAFFYLCPSLK